jgi:hypothetical protein
MQSTDIISSIWICQEEEKGSAGEKKKKSLKVVNKIKNSQPGRYSLAVFLC